MIPALLLLAGCADPADQSLSAPGLVARLDLGGTAAEGVTVEVDSATLRIALAALGRGAGAGTSVGPGLARATPERLTIEHPGVTEWWEAHPAGLEQGWTLSEAPAGTGPVRLDVAVHGAVVTDARGEAESDPPTPGALRWTLPDDRVLTYGGLHVEDADGHPVAAWLEATADGLAVVIDDFGARWPLTVDPLLSSATTVLTGGTNDTFGYSVSGAGDVNGDGYADLIVGAPYNSATAAEIGRAYVYLGGASGYGASPATTLTGAAAGDHFGRAVAGAGAVNADGYADVLVGADDNDAGGSTAGRVYVYLGSAVGVATAPIRTLTGAATGDRFGAAVAGAGDVNGDGYDDVLLGAYTNDAGGSQAGRAYVFHGNVGGVAAVASTFLTGRATYDYFGRSVAGAGDVNGDGYADVIVGAPRSSSGGGASGNAYVFHGSALGVHTSADRTLPGTAVDDQFGIRVAGGGDVNGDGYDDVLVGADTSDAAGTDAGLVELHLGSAVGVTLTASHTWYGDAASAHLGLGVANRGDANGDGFADVLLGAPTDYADGANGGRVLVDDGAAAGPDGVIDVTVDGTVALGWFGYAVDGAGDVDGDGYEDVAIGALYDSTGGASAGAVYLHRGSSDDADGDGWAYTVDCDDTDAFIGPLQTWYRDADGDTWGGASTSVSACVAPIGYVAAATDCDDSLASVHPGATETCNGRDDDCDGATDEDAGSLWYVDADGDTYGATSSTTLACTQPGGYVATATDCDDTRSSVHPGAREVCNSRDDDCDGSTDEEAASVWYRDSDGDGYGTSGTTTTSCTSPVGYVADATDCDDTSSLVHPGVSESCNGIDDDCNGTIDEGTTSPWYRDLDGDGYGDPGSAISACTAPSGYVASHTDCDDTAAGVHPGAVEVCNDADDNCDAAVDEGVRLTWYQDADSDGYGAAGVTFVACTAPTGYVENHVDCDDTRATVNPGYVEVCDGVDNDCDRAVDESGGAAWHPDADTDGYGDVATSVVTCTGPVGYILDGGDCDDHDPALHPGVVERCDGVDEDCDGTVDDGAIDGVNWYADADDDGYGTPTDILETCEAPDGYVANDADCWDGDAATRPGASEVPDGVDNDCDGGVDEGTTACDDDGDGYAEDGGDCDDVNPRQSPASPERDNAEDDDCDGLIDEGTDGGDDDGDGVSENAGDCNDGDADVAPGRAELPDNGVDDDCDGVVDGGAYDADGDGVTAAGGDCDDTDDAAHPGATEVHDGIDNDCDGGVDEGTSDTDGDGLAAADGDCDDTNPAVYPGAPEVMDGIDDDCDGLVDEGSTRTDDDGDGYSEEAGDCDDGDRGISPAAAETVDGIDQNCNGIIDEGFGGDRDDDGYTTAQGDCDDEDGWVHPDALDACDGRDEDCDGAVDEDCSTDTGITDPKKDGARCGCAVEGPRGSGVGLMVAGVLLVGMAGRRR